MFYKETKSLFLKKYQYKAVISCPGGHLFRGGDFDNALREMHELIKGTYGALKPKFPSRMFKSLDEVATSIRLVTDLKKMLDIELRVETPAVSIYTNDPKHIALLEKKYPDNLRYISRPAAPDTLDVDTIIMPKMKEYDYKVTMAASKQEQTVFLDWANQSTKLRVTNSCKRDLQRSRSWGGTHFYVAGDNNLLMAKMHLGGCISKIQRIAK
jgi:hypothetical protein